MEASLSDVFYVYLLLLRPRFFTNYVSFYEGLRPPRGPCSLWMVLVSLFCCYQSVSALSPLLRGLFII